MANCAIYPRSFRHPHCNFYMWTPVLFGAYALITIGKMGSVIFYITLLFIIIFYNIFLILHNLNSVCFITINNIKFIRRWNKNLTFVHTTIKDKRKKYIQDVCHLKKLCFKVTRGGHALLLLALSLFALCK